MTKEEAQHIAAVFRDMADRIEINGDSSFGGAYVIVPPSTGIVAGGIQPIAVLVLDSTQDQAGFFNLLSWKVKEKLDEIDKLSRAQGFR